MTNNKFAVIDCKTLGIKGYQGRSCVQEAKIEIDPDTTRKGLLEVIQGFRIDSDGATLDRERVLNQRYALADAEYRSWQQ